MSTNRFSIHLSFGEGGGNRIRIPCSETPVNIDDSEIPVEALIEILTEISRTDREMQT